MKNEQKLNVVVHGEPDLRKLSKDISDALVAALADEICKALKEQYSDKKEEKQ